VKICFLAHAGSIHTQNWARYFRDRGYQVSVVSLTPGEREAGIDLHYIPQRRQASVERTNWHYLWALPRLRRIVRDIDPDILNAHFLSSYGFLGALVRPPGCPFVISLHGSDVLLIPRRSLLHKWAARFALSRANLIVSVAKHMTRVVRSMIDQDRPILTVQYGVNTDIFRPAYDSSERGPICLSTRRLVPMANIDTILAAARIIFEGDYPFKFIFAGTGHQSTELQQNAAEWSTGRQVRFTGQLDRDRMAEALREAAIYVSMTSSDGMSLSLLEAMACGAFPVVSDIPANREWIRSGENGYLVPLGDPVLLADRLLQAWDDKELRRSAARSNWQLVQQKGEFTKNMGLIESAFTKLVSV